MFYGKVKLITRLIGGKRNEAYIIRRNYEFNDSSLVEGVLYTVSRYIQTFLFINTFTPVEHYWFTLFQRFQC